MRARVRGKGRPGGLSRHCCSRPVRLARCTGETSCFHINQLPSLSRRSPVGFIFARSRCCEEIKSTPPRSDYYRCVRAHSSRIIRCGYVGLTLCGAGPFYSLDSTRGDGINRSLSRSLRHRLIQTDLRDGRDAGEWGYGEQIGARE